MKMASSRNMVVATDDKAAINACRVFGIKFVTAIDFLLRAYEKEKISKEETKEKIHKLDEYGRYDTRIIKAALEKIGDKNE